MKAAILFLFILESVQAFSQPIVKNFELTNVMEGNQISPDDYKTHPGIVIWFTSQACPFDGYYRDRLKALINTYGKQIQFLLVNSCVEPEESVDKMKAVFTSWGVSVPYLHDKDQIAMNTLGARKSPEAFLLKPVVSGGYQIWYGGAIDDNPQSPAAVTNSYLKSAIDNLLAGKPAAPWQRSTGCTIKRK